MPLSEFYRTARGTLESAQEKTTTHLTDLSHVRDDEFVELVWGNGQIMMQSQSNRARRSLTSNNFQSQSVKLRDKDLGCGSVLIDFTTSGEVGLGQDDDMVPWLNYPIDDSLQHDYCSEVLPEFSGVTVNELSEHSSFLSIDKKSSDNQKIRGSHSVSVHTGSSLEQANSKVSTLVVGESSGSRNSQLYPLSVLECQRSRPSLRSGVSGVAKSTDNTPRAVSGDSFQVQGPASGLPSIKIQKPDSGIHNSDPRFISFSRFSRPAAHRADIQSVGPMATPGSWGVGEMGDNNKGTFPRRSDLAESTPDDLRGFLRKEMGSLEQLILVPPKADSEPGVLKRPVGELHTAEQSAAISEENVVKNDIMPNQVLDSSAPKGTPDCGKTIEPVVASSSVCSGNSAERASNDPTLDLKRKVRETSDYSEGRSEDVEEESIGVRKAAPARGGTGSKRSRAAEVHNLSERRRRDRINEKMRALQELIPNCNKVDKASMLDEAIEYLKTLQLQVQFMSMGAGLYMPPMMFPTGIQHLQSAHMARFSPMAVGMGMGLGYGIGMLDMNGGSAGCPVIQVPPMQGAHFPVPRPTPISGPTNFQGMAGSGSNLQVLGHPSQGLPMSAPIANLATLSGGPPLDSAMGHVK